MTGLPIAHPLLTRPSYFPTVYEPTVFENYVHGTIPRFPAKAAKSQDASVAILPLPI